METWQKLLEYGRQCLKEAGIAEYELDAWYLLEYVTGINRTQYLCDRDGSASPEQVIRYKELITVRAGRLPLQQITGEQEFMGLVFHVNEHVLIPRQDTEILVEEAGKLLKQTENARILDMCTGSGCILISLMKLYGASAATGADISEEALQVAAENARKNQAEVTLIQSNLFSAVSGSFDFIVSNPPYIRSGVITTLEPEVRHEPLLALDGGEDGLSFYRRIVRQAREFLVPGGHLLFEIGHDQGKEVSELFLHYGYMDVKVVKDLAGLDRVCMGKYMEE